MREEILSGNEIEKPGFVRLNSCHFATDAKANRIITAVLELAGSTTDHADGYTCDAATAIFKPKKLATAR